MTTSPPVKAKIIALREIGFSTAHIASAVGASERTIKRVCKYHNVDRGSLMDEARHQVSKSVVDDICNDSQIKDLITGLANHVLIHSSQAQSRLQDASSRTGKITSLDQYLKLARAESASAAALKANVDTIRSLLAFGEGLSGTAELPVLTIRRLTSEEVDNLRKEHQDQDRALGMESHTDSADDPSIVVEKTETKDQDSDD